MPIIPTSELNLLQGEWPEQRIGLFVDTQNLYYSAKDNYGKAVSYQRLLDLAVCARRLQQATAYVVDRDGSAQGFMTKLRDIGYRIKSRQVEVFKDDSGNEVLEGDWDMGIAADMVRQWKHLDVIVLASGDGDFVPILELAQEKGCRVEILAFKETCHSQLINCVDKFTELGTQSDIFL